MKLNRLLTASVLGLSLLTTSAFACDHGSSNGSSGDTSYWSFLGFNHRDTTHHDEENNRGRECDRGKGNDSSGCTTGSGGSTSGGSTSGGSTSGGSTSGGGATVGPKG